MHKEPPPKQAINGWLKANGTIVDEGRYGHMLLEQQQQVDDDLIAALLPYFKSAHADARQHFHEKAGFDLHPDADEPGANACYPQCLPTSAIRGLFGEVMAGLVTEAFQDEFVGAHPWKVPIFLFREHAAVEKYIYDLARNPADRREVFGRFGSDFLGICLGPDGAVTRFIAGEAKWRISLSQAVVDQLMLGGLNPADPETGLRTRKGNGVWREINRDTPVPHGLRQLQGLLKHRDPEGHAAAILSLDAALTLLNPVPLPRTNLVLIVGNAAPKRQALSVLIPWEQLPEPYTAEHDLQVVEVILEDGESLIEALYRTPWIEEA